MQDTGFMIQDPRSPPFRMLDTGCLILDFCTRPFRRVAMNKLYLVWHGGYPGQSDINHNGVWRGSCNKPPDSFPTDQDKRDKLGQAFIITSYQGEILEQSGYQVINE